MKSITILLMTAASLFAGQEPVLVELFTSEGCSSCPPADALLERLDKDANVIVLSEHVDYWNDIGWRDPFSDARYSERQSRYADRFKGQGVYTPQMVVDGSREFVGSDARAADAAIRTARPKVPVQLQSDGSGGVRVSIAESANSGDVLIAFARNEAASAVSAGENRGRKLHHVAVVREIRTAGELKPGAQFEKRITLPADPANLRVIAWVQEHGQGRVLGVAQLKP